MKKKKSLPPTKPGVARQYLVDHYSPINDQDLKMGHVFLLLMEQDKSVAKTIRAVRDILPCIIRPNDMKTVLNNLNSFKHLSREVKWVISYSAVVNRSPCLLLSASLVR